MRGQLDILSGYWRRAIAIVVATMALTGCQQTTGPAIVPGPTQSTTRATAATPGASEQR